MPKWADAFVAEITKLTGTSEFTCCLAVTSLKGDSSGWAADPIIRDNPFRFLNLETMWSKVLSEVTTTPASSEMGHLAQILTAARLTAAKPLVAPTAPVPGSVAGMEDALYAQNDTP